MSQQSIALDPLSFPLHGCRLIEASAGTGKTFTIALLYVRLVLGHGGENAFGRPLSPPEILVVTFTEVATQELRERIRSRLSEAAYCFAEPQGRHDDLLLALREQYPSEQWPRCARLLHLATEWMDEAAVSTIHSWCYRMLREHAFDSGSLFTQNLRSDQSELLAEVVRDYWRRNFYALSMPAALMVASCFSGPDALGKALRPLLARQGADFRYAGQALQAPECLADLLEQGGEWYRRLDELEQQARAAWCTAQGELEEILRDLRQNLNGNSYRDKDNDETFGAWLEALTAWSEGGEIPANLDKFGQTRIKLTAKRIAPEHSAFQAIDALIEHREKKPEIAPYLLLHALGEVGRELEVEKQRRAEIGFDDLLNHLDRALQGSSGERLAELIREQFAVALIDEFQDTDPVQYRIFESIYRITVDPDTSMARETGLFMIGDPKQAIYAFRGADIHTYLRAREATRGRHYTLDRNFRSTQAMVAAVNRCFAFAEKYPRGAFRFTREGADNPLPFVGVAAQGRDEWLLIDGAEVAAMTLWHLDAGDDVLGVALYRQEMAECSASIIQRWLNLSDQGCAGFRKNDGSWRALCPADIAILVRDRAEAEAVRRALVARQLASVYLSDRDSVFDSREAHDLLLWLRACADPGAEASLRGALASRSLHLDWATLERLNQDEPFWEQQVLRFREYCRLWRSQGVLPMLRRLFADFELMARFLQCIDGERSLTNLLHLAEWLQRAAVELDGEHALIRYLAEQVQDPGGEEVLRLESDADLIKVVTIHKSKGLEYPLVLLPFICSWKELDGRKGVPASFHDDQYQVQVIELARGKELAAGAYEQANDERLSEDMRLLYVALTRARYAVWLGIAPLVVDHGKSSRLHRGAIGYLLGGGDVIGNEQLRERLDALKGDCSAIVVEPAPEVDDQCYVMGGQDGGLGLARETRRSCRERWWIASYSALQLRAGSGELLNEDTETRVGPLEPTSAEEATFLEEGRSGELDAAVAYVLSVRADLHRFPRGPVPGTFLHGLLEWAGRESFDLALADAAARREMVVRRCNLRGWQNWIESLDLWLEQYLVVPLRWPGGETSLAELGAYQVEMEFWVASHQVQTEAIDALVRRYTLGGVPRPALESTSLNGMFKGFIDLVFERNGRYYVADYKSNWLGADDNAYSTEAMIAVVLENRYDLQYVLYLLALHRQLKARLPSYDYERHMGGALYLFLRGARAVNQGVHFECPPRELIERLDALFSGHREEEV